MATPVPGATPPISTLLPVLPLRDQCLFPAASLSLVIARPGSVKALEMALRTGGRVLALAQRDAAAVSASARELHATGTVAQIASDVAEPDGTHRVELDGLQRARAIEIVGVDALVADAEALTEGDPGDEWGPAVEALARYMHSHAELRKFLDEQRRSAEPMAWVNLACQHLPITATARQRLLESDAPARCLRISRGLDALLRKEQGN